MKTITTLILLALCASAADSTTPLPPSKLGPEPKIQDLPGLMPVDVYLNLQAKGFTIEKKFAADTGGSHSEFICRKDEGSAALTAIIYIPKDGITKVTAVAAVVKTDGVSENETNVLASSFLGYVASLPYKGSEPASAYAWAAATVGKTTEKMFGPAKMETLAEKQVRVLRISMEPLKEKAAKAPAPIAAEIILPPVGTVYADVVKVHGKPKIQDADTGWAIWTGFKVKFKDGAVVEASRTPSS